ncbi:MAG: cellobiose phosphorylase [Firmicutes bacterium]|nr:cellobiose phosphorylase [Bacillota bacterium]
MKGWRFVNDRAEFEIEDPQLTNYLYFPLANEAGMMSSITPLLHGDIKTGQNTFLTAPVTVEDLHNSRSARNFWVYLEDSGPWSAAGNSAAQAARIFVAEKEKVTVTGGFLWHRVTRINEEIGISAEITNFVPCDASLVELMRVKITNLRSRTLIITPTAAIPIYGRSADNLRDHRHVTSLLHRIRTTPYGVEVQPTFCFDERGHRVNRITYGVLGCDGTGKGPLGTFPVLEEFIGEGGSLEWPEAVVKNRRDAAAPGAAFAGYEAMGALRFADAVLEPGDAATYIIVIAVSPDGTGLDSLARRYGTGEAFAEHLRLNQEHWEQKLSRLTFSTGDVRFNGWLKWVNLQPVLRRIYGCSFLPHHDYGRGGRGWRDLWQDCLTLLLLDDPTEVRDLLFNNFAGVRIDGSNATIIGARPGEFIADRNNIRRVWMDHGAWPFLATKLYIDQSGDLEFLLQEQTYFQDGQACRSRVLDPEWQPEDGNRLKQKNGELYRGTIVEHLLVQLVTEFYNVGEHNHLRLEGADWNDALDMAAERGESVAFTALYAYDLMELGGLLLDMRKELGRREIEVAAEFLPLCDSIYGAVDYDSVDEKRALLGRYFASTMGRISGAKARIDLEELAADLKRKAAWIGNHIRNSEWLRNAEGYQWFNGYYDNDGKRVEGDGATGVRMTLTGQVFAIMGGIATDEQVAAAIKAVDRYLKDPELGGYRLNTDFGGVQTNLGRAFAFAYGHKENGAIFSHMAVMYGNALYKRGFVREGHAVLDSLYRLSTDFNRSRIYPGLPEYMNNKGRGVYHYLTGSASWYLLTMLNEVYGVKGHRGDLVLEPKLVREQFDAEGIAKVGTVFADRELEVVYHNPLALDYESYEIQRILIDRGEVAFARNGRAALIARRELAKLAPGRHRITVELGRV